MEKVCLEEKNKHKPVMANLNFSLALPTIKRNKNLQNHYKRSKKTNSKVKQRAEGGTTREDSLNSFKCLRQYIVIDEGSV